MNLYTILRYIAESSTEVAYYTDLYTRPVYKIKSIEVDILRDYVEMKED